MSVGGFVPKPHTPFQWFGQNGVDELQPQDRAAARRRCAGPAPRSSGTTRGPRSPRASSAGATAGSARVIERVWRAGGTFQEWSEHFDARPLDSTPWRPRASTPTGTSPATAPRDEVLPWDHIAAGLHKDFLWEDWQAALAEHGLPDCRWTPCYDCGVCTDYALEHVVASPVAPAGGSQGTGQDLAVGGSGAGPVPLRGAPMKPPAAVRPR